MVKIVFQYFQVVSETLKAQLCSVIAKPSMQMCCGIPNTVSLLDCTHFWLYDPMVSLARIVAIQECAVEGVS